MPNEEIKLKPCPFCGAMPRIDKNQSTMKYWIQCDNPKCKINPCTDMHINLSVITREWNRRVKDAE